MKPTTHVDVVRPGRALVTGTSTGRPDRDGFSGGIVREGRDYSVEDEYGNTIGRAKTYRAGAERLARHYDTDPGHIEITYERDERGWSGDAEASRASAETHRHLDQLRRQSHSQEPR